MWNSAHASHSSLFSRLFPKFFLPEKNIDRQILSSELHISFLLKAVRAVFDSVHSKWRQSSHLLRALQLHRSNSQQ